MTSESLRRIALLIAGVASAACGGSVGTAHKPPLSVGSLDEAKQQAASSGRPILVDVYADW